ncbi:TonB-dependent receptor domain-containing protein [Aliiglaciecola lipolytica]|uniref:TonB-dependent receptor, plug n=1 Tax=Aliiglaciecola lipolytica E3 TaxID=1127673 RepID=K6YAX4_9ALTE|nr:TonB-dependent receptor [Aliiglaciecola lipolytica]GAC15322.1 TonB-dependent receptor, plug [Aliiglaciecola lipolytica E3]
MKQLKNHSENRFFKPNLLSFTIAALMTMPVAAQQTETEDPKNVEKIQVVGTHIKGGQVAEALAISVLDADAIGSLGIDSIDDLLQVIPENGQNFFNEAENIGGGVNAARGDIGTYNLRNLGTGNTLVLLNGRRLVNSASYQTEEVGGSFVPVNSVNVNTIPVVGLDRVEVLRDGASAIYGADAVAGVVNHVLKSDFVGFTISGRWAEYENIPRDTQTLTVEWGKDFNNGRTNISAFVNYYARDRVNSQDDPRWANSDFRSRIPEGSLWEGDTAFRNDTANSLFGQYDVVSSASAAGLTDMFTDNAGEFETYPIGDERCEYVINATTCGGQDGQGTYRLNLNADRDISSELKRFNFFAFINHEFENGMEAFTELSFYKSETNLRRHATAPFTTSKLRVGAENYYNPFGPCGSPNRLPDEMIPDVPCSGLELTIDNYRFAELPRIVDNDGKNFRFLQGFRGVMGDWDWETAVSYSKAEKDDVTHNRVSNNLISEALFDSTEAAYNPFSGGLNSNIERALIDVVRLSETELTTFDVKFSHPEIFTLPAGPVGFVVGLEYREESFVDDRDDRLDGTITFTDYEGDTYPYVSDVVNSSPTPDSSGEREVSSLFGEVQIPIFETLNAQVALRYEDFSDVGNTTVGKVAFGWRPLDEVLVRGSWSEAFRAPNLITINESIVARNNTRTDYTCLYAAENGGDPDQDILDCTNSVQRIAQGSDNLKPEESTNTSVGIVLTPTDEITFTLDYWSIQKENTIGLYGEENHTLLDLLLRLENGTANCGSGQFNSAVSRQDADSNQTPVYEAAGICPAGDIQFIDDQYANLDDRNLSGFDVGFYYNVDTEVGRFKFSYNGSFIDEFEQQAGGDAARLVEAQQSGLIPASYPVSGFADLIGQDGNQKQRHSMRLSWREGDFGASLSGNRIGSFYQSSLTLDDGTRYEIPAMTTFNATFDYTFDYQDIETRLRFGIRNLTDERAPLADRYFGYFSDAHSDYGRSFYVDFRTKL